MFSQAELETILAIGIVLICLAASTNIYWILNGWPFGKAQDAQIWKIRRAFRGWMLRKWLEGDLHKKAVEWLDGKGE